MRNPFRPWAGWILSQDLDQVTGGRSANEDLRREITEFKARLAELEAKQNSQWLNQRRSEEIKALVDDVLSDADTRASLLENGVTAGHNGKAFYLASQDGSFLLKINGQIQLRYLARFQDSKDSSSDGDPLEDATGILVSPSVEDETETGFVIRRAKLKFSGHIADPKLNYVIQLFVDRKSNSVSSDKIVISYALTDNLTIWGGEDKAPFLREELTSSSRQLAVERTYANELFTLDKVQGVGLKWKANENVKFHVMFNDGSNSGNGKTKSNPFTQTASSQTPVDEDGDPTGVDPDDFPGCESVEDDGDFLGVDCSRSTTKDFDEDRTDFAITARGDFKFAGNWSQMKDFTAFEGEEQAIFLGAAIHYEVGETGDAAYNNNFLTWTVDASYENAGFNIYAAVIGQHTDLEHEKKVLAEDLDLYGLIVQAGYLIPNSGWEPFARYEYIDLDDAYHNGFKKYDDVNIVTFGVNRYFNKHAAKFTLDVVWALDALPISQGGLGLAADHPNQDDQVVVRGQFQLLF